MTITHDDIKHAIYTCPWRNTTMGQGYEICNGELAPCMRVIESGKCEAIKEIIRSADVSVELRKDNDANTSNKS